MDFHKIPSEKIRDQIIDIFLSKDVFKEGVTIEELKELVPFDTMDNPACDSSEDETEPDVTEEVFSDTISDNESSSEEQEKEEKPEKPKKEKKVKKEKKEKKEKSDKPSKPASSFVFFKSHPDSQDSIVEAASEINDETGKPFGKVKGAGFVWKTISDEEKEEWKQRAIEDFESKQSSDNTD